VTLKGQKIKFIAVTKIVYLFFLLLVVVYVKNVLDTDSFKATERVPEKPIAKVKEANVKLLVETGNIIKEYSLKLTDGNSVQDLLYQLRKTKDFYYEFDRYTYGIVLVSVFGKEPDNGGTWAVFLDDKDITKDISQTNLQDKAVYTIRQIPS